MQLVVEKYLYTYAVGAVLISDLDSVRYLTGFSGSNGLVLITKTKLFLFTDFRYMEQVRKEVPKNIAVIQMGRDVWGDISEILKDEKINKLGFEAGAVYYNQFLSLKKKLPHVTLVPIKEDSDCIREIKSAIEIKKITKALAINRLAFDEVRRLIKPGTTENEVALMLEHFLRSFGAEKLAFDTIVASGWRGALPHGKASNKKIKAGELVTVDFGGVYQGYHADETVTVGVGKLSAKQKEIHQVVLEAQQAAREAAGPGVSCAYIDKAARDYISRKGYGQYFGHALGHGVGLEVHERPVLSPASKDILQPGMVFTIEPGIYIPKFGGVRIEDVFVCENAGVRRLSKIFKKII